MKNDEVFCYKCSKPIEYEVNRRIPREEECPHCFEYLHCCKMCIFYKKSSYNECLEPVSQRIIDKEKNNFCDFFKIGHVGENTTNEKSLLDNANDLFK